MGSISELDTSGSNEFAAPSPSAGSDEVAQEDGVRLDLMDLQNPVDSRGVAVGHEYYRRLLPSGALRRCPSGSPARGDLKYLSDRYTQ